MEEGKKEEENRGQTQICPTKREDVGFVFRDPDRLYHCLSHLRALCRFMFVPETACGLPLRRMSDQADQAEARQSLGDGGLRGNGAWAFEN
jgi:hypothetical protein